MDRRKEIGQPRLQEERLVVCSLCISSDLMGEAYIHLGGGGCTDFGRGRAIEASKTYPFLIPIFEKSIPDLIPIFQKCISDYVYFIQKS